jgi:broad specificity phosphatase PhoE
MVEQIFLVRHAEAESNAKRYFAGWLDSPLTELGKAQALALSKRLPREKVDKIFCSTSQRARDTLDLIGLKAPVVYSPNLREKNYGKLEGTKWGGVEGSEVYHMDPFVRAPGGESTQEVQKRVVSFFEKEIFPLKEKKVLVVSHHGALITFSCHMLGIPINRWRGLRLGNGGLSLFVKEEGIWRLKLWNSLSSLGLLNDGPLLKIE